MAISRYRSRRRAARRVAAVVAVTMAMAALGACGGGSPSVSSDASDTARPSAQPDSDKPTEGTDAAGLVAKMKSAGIKCLDVDPDFWDGPNPTSTAACGIAISHSGSESDGADTYESDDSDDIVTFTVATYSDKANTDDAAASDGLCEVIRGPRFVVGVYTEFQRIDQDDYPIERTAREAGRQIADAIGGKVVTSCEPPPGHYSGKIDRAG